LYIVKTKKLKKLFTILLFVSFAARPIYYAGYATYFQLNLEYIIETYCVNKEKPKLKCDGKCHLSKQLQINTEEAENNLAIINFSESFFPVYCIDYPSLNFDTIEIRLGNKINIIHAQNYTYCFEKNNFRPPAA
jgi:hypothetical protein